MAFFNGAGNGSSDDFGADMADRIVPAALRAWLLFLLLFIVLGYPVGFSILFGAAGGFAWGTVSAWWSIPGGVPLPDDFDDIDEVQERAGRARLGFKLPEWQLRRAKRRRIYRRGRE